MLTTGGFVYAQVVNIQRADRPQGRRLPGFLKNAENVPQDFSLRGVNPDRPPVIRENEALTWKSSFRMPGRSRASARLISAI